MSGVRGLAKAFGRIGQRIEEVATAVVARKGARIVQRDVMAKFDKVQNAVGRPLGRNTRAWTAWKRRRGFSSRRGIMAGAMRRAMGSRGAIWRVGGTIYVGIPDGAVAPSGKRIAWYAGLYSSRKAGGKLIAVSADAEAKIAKLLTKRLADWVVKKINAEV